MDSSSREREREHLEHQLDTETAKALLRKVQRREEQAQEFESWQSVAAYMRTGASDDPRKDAILRAIATCREEDPHPLWSSVLLVFFWSGLLTMFGKRRTWDPEQDELWQTIIVEFLEAFERLDVKRRPTRIAKKIVNDTYCHTYRAYTPRWRRLAREHQVEPEHFEGRVAAGAGIDLTAIELTELQDLRLDFFREAFVAGVIGEDDLFLLIGTDVYGQSVVDYARALEGSYQALKKRRQRAHAAIEAWRWGRRAECPRRPWASPFRFSTGRGSSPARRDQKTEA